MRDNQSLLGTKSAWLSTRKAFKIPQTLVFIDFAVATMVHSIAISARVSLAGIMVLGLHLDQDSREGKPL